MKKLNYEGYKELRDGVHKQAGIVGDAAERFENSSLGFAYDYVSSALDEIDAYGIQLEYLDSETFEYIERKG